MSSLLRWLVASWLVTILEVWSLLSVTLGVVMVMVGDLGSVAGRLNIPYRAGTVAILTILG